MILLLFALFEGEFLNVGIDAGSWGRGSTGLVYPITSYLNPAASLILQPGGNCTGSRLFGDLANLIAGGVNMKGEDFGFSVNFILHSVGDIHYTMNALLDLDGDGELDIGEELDEDLITYFSSREGALIGSYARWFGELSAGVALKFIYKRILNEVAYGAGTDIGFIYNKGHFSVAALIRDFTTSPIIWKGRTEHIAPSYLLGFGVRRMIGTVDVLMELDLIQDDYGFNHHLGIEVGINKWLIARSGFINEQLTAGIGLRRTPVSVDYAANIHPELPLSHRVSILYAF